MTDTLTFYPPPDDLPVIEWTFLKPGDCLLTSDQQWWVSGAIQGITDSPWSHAAMVVADADNGGLFVAEMTWPKCRVTALDAWLESNKPVFACRLIKWLPLLDANRLWSWWRAKVGAPYDFMLLLTLGPVTWWQRLSTWLRLPLSWRRIQPWAGSGVCSVCVSWAWQAAGLAPDEDTGMTPADIPRQEFVLPVERVLT